MKKLQDGVRVNIMLDKEADNRLDKLAEYLQLSRSELIRLLIEREYRLCDLKDEG